MGTEVALIDNARNCEVKSKSLRSLFTKHTSDLFDTRVPWQMAGGSCSFLLFFSFHTIELSCQEGQQFISTEKSSVSDLGAILSHKER